MPWAARRCPAHLRRCTWNTEMLRSLSHERAHDQLLGTCGTSAHTHLWHFRSFRPCVFSWRQSKNIQPVLDVVSGDHGTGKGQRGPRRESHAWPLNQVCRPNQIRGWSMLIYADLLAGGLRGWFGSVYRLQICPAFALSHGPCTAFIPTWVTAVLWLRPTCAAKRLCPSADSGVPSGDPLSPDSRAHCLSTAVTWTDTLQYIEFINICIADFGKWWFNV